MLPRPGAQAQGFGLGVKSCFLTSVAQPCTPRFAEHSSGASPSTPEAAA